MRYLLIFVMLFPVALDAQEPAIPRDTSFTVAGAYAKALKTNPGITIPNPVAPGVKVVENVIYKTINGRPLRFDVFLPPDAKKPERFPAVVLIHGGGWRSGDRSNHYPMARMLAARGFVAITVEYRLSTEDPYPAAVNDLKDAIRQIRGGAHHFFVDKQRIALWGFSAGGQLAALLAGLTKVNAVIDVDGILSFTHPESGEGDDSKGLSAATLWFGAPKSAGTKKWEEASALNHVTKKYPPTLFINSAVARMHAGRDDLIRKLEAFRVSSEVHTFPDAPHTFPLFEPWFTPTLDYTVAFLERVFPRR